MLRLMRSLALVAGLSALCGCTSLLIAGCSTHEGSGRLPTDTSKPPMMPPGGYGGSSHSKPANSGGSGR